MACSVTVIQTLLPKVLPRFDIQLGTCGTFRENGHSETDVPF